MPNPQIEISNLISRNQGIRRDTGSEGNEYYYRQDGRTPEPIINPTEADFQRLNSIRIEESNGKDYKTLIQYRLYKF